MEMIDFTEQPSIEDTVQQIQQGNKDLQNYLLKAYQPFIAKTVSEVCKRFINPEKDDEFSIGLYAFNEALFLYAKNKGSTFLSFAKLIIKRKVIDYIRYQARRQQAISFDQYYDEDLMENPAEIVAVLTKYDEERDTSRLHEEIIEYITKLREYNLCIAELEEIAPKHWDARDNAVCVARTLTKDKAMREYVLSKKKLPMKRLEKSVHLSKKTLERNRKYILAVFIVLNGNFIYLEEYIKDKGK
ncbi:RNA polymerase sigma-I factor [Oceanobacillus sp. CAU 1775]